MAFLPLLADRLAKGDRKAVWELTSSILNTLAIVMGLVAVVVLIFAEQLITIISSKLDPVHHHQAVIIMRLIALNPLLFTLSGIITTVQQSFGRFFFYALAPLFYNLTIILSIFLFRHNIGVIGLGMGALVGALLQLGVASLGLIGLEFKYVPKINWKNQGFRQLLRQLPSRSLDQGIDSLNSIVEINRAVALGIKGAASYYEYALMIHNVPISLIGTSVATAAFPRLTDRLAQRRTDLFRRDFLQILRTMIWMAMPVVVICYFCRGYLARIISGDVNSEVTLLLGFLSMAIFFRIIYSIVSRYFYAQKDTWTPLMVSIFAIGLNIVLAFNWARKDSYGIAGLAMAQSFVAASEVMVLLSIMLWRDHKLFDRFFIGGLIKIVSVTGFTLLAAFTMISFLPLRLNDIGIITLGTKLGLIAGITLAAHLVVSWIFGLEEVNPLINKLRKLVLARVKIQ